MNIFKNLKSRFQNCRRRREESQIVRRFEPRYLGSYRVFQAPLKSLSFTALLASSLASSGAVQLLNHTAISVISGPAPIPLRTNVADSGCGLVVVDGRTDPATGLPLKLSALTIIVGYFTNAPFSASATLTVRYVPSPDSFSISDLFTAPPQTNWTFTVPLTNYTWTSLWSSLWGDGSVPRIQWRYATIDITSFNAVPALGQRVGLAYAVSDDSAQPTVPLSNYRIFSPATDAQDRLCLGGNLAAGTNWSGTILQIGWTGTCLGAALDAEPVFRPVLTAVNFPGGGNLGLRVTGAPGTSYTVQYTPDFLLWTPFYSFTMPTGSSNLPVTFPNPAPGAPQLFFRVSINGIGAMQSPPGARTAAPLVESFCSQTGGNVPQNLPTTAPPTVGPNLNYTPQ